MKEILKLLNSRRKWRETANSWANYSDPDMKQAAMAAFVAGCGWMAQEMQNELKKTEPLNKQTMALIIALSCGIAWLYEALKDGSNM